MGYQSQTLYNIIVKSVGTPPLLFKLDPVEDALDEVVIFQNPFKKTKETPLSTQTFSAVEIETYPGGNNDIAKVVQSMPGISPPLEAFEMILSSVEVLPMRRSIIWMVLKFPTSTILVLRECWWSRRLTQCIFCSRSNTLKFGFWSRI